MASNEAHNRAVAKYMESRKKLTITVDKETAEKLKVLAEERGSSVQAVVVECLQESTKIKEANYYNVKLPKAKVDEIAKESGVKPAEYLKSVTKTILNPDQYIEQLAKRFIQGK